MEREEGWFLQGQLIFYSVLQTHLQDLPQNLKSACLEPWTLGSGIDEPQSQLSHSPLRPPCLLVSSLSDPYPWTSHPTDSNSLFSSPGSGRWTFSVFFEILRQNDTPNMVPVTDPLPPMAPSHLTAPVFQGPGLGPCWTC